MLNIFSDNSLLYITQPTTLCVICVATASQICYSAVFLSLIEQNYKVRQFDALQEHKYRTNFSQNWSTNRQV